LTFPLCEIIEIFEILLYENQLVQRKQTRRILNIRAKVFKNKELKKRLFMSAVF